MTIGKRKGVAVKGSGAAGSSPGSGNKVGGVLSKSDHFYLQEAFGTIVDPGTLVQSSMEASGGAINDYTTPTGDVYRSHTFATSGTFEVSTLGANIPGPYNNKVDVIYYEVH